MARAPRKTAGKKPAAKKTTSKAVAKPKTGTNVADIRKQMAAQAEASKNMEKDAAFGRSFSFKNGVMKFDGQEVEGNRAIVVIADAIIEKGYYDTHYDSDNPVPPACYAFGYDPDEIAPNEEDVEDLQCETCEACPLNVFGSADVGKGKACKDSRRLLLIPAGKYKKDDIELYDDPDHFAKAEMAQAKLPPTSLNAFATFVRQVAGTMQLPPHGIFAEMVCEADDSNQFKVFFEPIEEVPDELLPIMMQRREEAQEMIARPYKYGSEEDEKPKGRGKAKPKGKTSRAKPKGKARGRKY